jgi:uncharacterized membrane protein YeaQ/YmgE (transglycosylase-associated protein family)
MIVIGMSAGQLVWALLPTAKVTGWPLVIGLGVAGSFIGGMLMSVLLHGMRGETAHFHSLGLVGSIAGTAALVGFVHLRPNSRL